MKAVSFFIMLFFSLQHCEAQKAVVANLRENIAYIGIPNALGILAEGYKWDKIEVSTDNGTIEKNDEPPYYSYWAKNEGKANILLKSKKGDTIFIQRLRVRFLPNPIPEIGGQNGGKLYKNRLLVYPGIATKLKGFDLEIRIAIRTFSIAILRNDSSIFVKNNYIGYFFPKELKDEFEKTKQGDKLIFYGITAQGPDKRILELSPMEFTIIE